MYNQITLWINQTECQYCFRLPNLLYIFNTFNSSVSKHLQMSHCPFSYFYTCVRTKTSVCPSKLKSHNICRCEGCLLLWNGHPLKCSGFPVDLPVPFSPVQSARKFSAVLGVISANSSKTIRPAVDRKQFSVTLLHMFSRIFWAYWQCDLLVNSLELVTTYFQYIILVIFTTVKWSRMLRYLWRITIIMAKLYLFDKIGLIRLQ